MRKMTEEEKQSIVNDLIDHEYKHACKKHPHFAHTLDRAYVILGEKVGEVATAIQENKHTEIIMELAQVAAICKRLIGLAMEKDACNHKPDTCGFFDDGFCNVDSKPCAEYF